MKRVRLGALWFALLAIGCGDGSRPGGADMATGGVDAGGPQCKDDTECPAGRVCMAGTCAVGCNAMKDNCPPGMRCVQANGSSSCMKGCKGDAECTAAHGPSSACCNGACADKMSDAAHCGGCGMACNGDTCCAGKCSDTAKDSANCGGCGKACVVPNAGAGCADSKCTVAMCNVGFGDCDKLPTNGCEANLDTDPNNCLACGSGCVVFHGVAGCNKGCVVASCEMGFADCDKAYNTGCEANLGDFQNCGGCGVLCSSVNIAKPTCSNGMCDGMCDYGFGDCDNDRQSTGCETDILVDVAHCGGCGLACSNNNVVNVTCGNGVCLGQCTAGFGDCNGNLLGDGCEVNTGTSPVHCGACQMGCSNNHIAVAVCTAGLCTGACDNGFSDCDNNKRVNGCETQGPCPGLKVAVMGGNLYTDDVRLFLAGQPGITSATRIDACDLPTLQQYKVVVLHGNMTCFDAANFTAYVQGGGAIVATPWIHSNNQGFAALPVNYAAGSTFPNTALAVTVTNPNDPLLAGVAFAMGNAVGYEAGAYTLRNGATNSVVWTAAPQPPSVARWTYGNGRAVYLDFHYITSDCQRAINYPWGKQLIYNSVLWAGAALPVQFFDSLTVQSGVANKGINSGCGTQVRVNQNVTINSIAVSNAMSADGNMRFVIFDTQDTMVPVYVSAPRAFLMGGQAWRQSEVFSYTLQAGKSYHIGALSDQPASWYTDQTIENIPELSSLIRNPNFGNFNTPTASCCGAVDCGIRLFR